MAKFDIIFKSVTGEVIDEIKNQEGPIATISAGLKAKLNQEPDNDFVSFLDTDRAVIISKKTFGSINIKEAKKARAVSKPAGL